MLEFYFRFQFSSSDHHRHSTLQQPSKHWPNRTTHSRVVTSWRFSRWRPRHRISTSGFVFRDFVQLGMSTFICRPNFDEMSQCTAIRFLKQKSAMLEFYFRFRFLRSRDHRHVILPLPTKLGPNRTVLGEVTTWRYLFIRRRQRYRISTSGFILLRNFSCPYKPRSRDPTLIFGPLDICTVNHRPLVGLCLDSNEDRGATEHYFLSYLPTWKTYNIGNYRWDSNQS